MKMGNDDKKKKLIENFEVIKDDLEVNGRVLGQSVAMMFKLNPAIAIEMWVYLLEHHENCLSDSHLSYFISGAIIADLEKFMCKSAVVDWILSNSILKNYLFSRCSSVWSLPNVMSSLIVDEDLESLDELLELLYYNKYKTSSFYEILVGILPEEEEMYDEAYELLLRWGEKLENPAEKAKLNIKLMEYIE